MPLSVTESKSDRQRAIAASVTESVPVTEPKSEPEPEPEPEPDTERAVSESDEESAVPVTESGPQRAVPVPDEEQAVPVPTSESGPDDDQSIPDPQRDDPSAATDQHPGIAGQTHAIAAPTEPPPTEAPPTEPTAAACLGSVLSHQGHRAASADGPAGRGAQRPPPHDRGAHPVRRRGGAPIHQKTVTSRGNMNFDDDIAAWAAA